MITVGDVMNMRAFDSIWLATPCDGAAAHEVTGVGTLDHEPFTGGGVHPGANSCSPRAGFRRRAPRSGRRGAACAHRVRRGGGGREARGAEDCRPRWCQASAARGVPVFFYEGAIWNGSSPTS